MITTFIVNLEEILQGHILLLKILFIYYIVMYKTLLNAIKNLVLKIVKITMK